jgi:lipopolysaccharide/colanic/teichoic acid biosynthesis glycosyltransferase
MRVHLPSSCAYFRPRFSIFDPFWAALSPLLALYIRGAYILSAEGAWTAALYCGISFVFALIAFLAFRLNEGLSRYFSVHDAVNILKASSVAGLMTAVTLFTFTRLEGIPRSTPLICVFILASGLITSRALALLRDNANSVPIDDHRSPREHLVMIGANHLSALYIKLVRSYSPNRHRVIAVLDNEASLFGRRIVGVPVVSTVSQIERTIEEFVVHGVCIDRIIVGGDDTLLSKDSLALVEHVCNRYDIQLQFVPQLIGLDAFKAKPKLATAVLKPAPSLAQLPSYHRAKRFVDFFVSGAAILLLSPVIALISLLVLIDLGSPVVFWQQRVGRGGNSFFLYKFRTLHPPFDRQGLPVSEEDRRSWIGRLLRNARLDEIPQLLNVLVGEMSLIGPRPLLPEDQPINANLRLSARPGITGWAQVNGGNLITNDEKGALDEWYVRHASFLLDSRILASTVGFVFKGEKRSESALRLALLEQRKAQCWTTPAATRKAVREELAPTFRMPFAPKANSVKIRAQRNAHSDRLVTPKSQSLT